MQQREKSYGMGNERKKRLNGKVYNQIIVAQFQFSFIFTNAIYHKIKSTVLPLNNDAI